MREQRPLNNDDRLAYWPKETEISVSVTPADGKTTRSFARRRSFVSAFYAVVACPTFMAGLWGTGHYGSAWYGVVGLVIALLLLWASSRMARWI